MNRGIYISIVTKKDVENLQSEWIRQNDKIIRQTDKIIGQNDKIIQLLEIIAGTETEIKFAETGEKICPYCKRMNSPENTFCQNCGNKI